MTQAEHFGRNLVKARTRAGLSQTELAFRTGLHWSAISLIERGGRSPRLDTLLRLLEGLEADADVLLDGLRPKPKQRQDRPLRSP